MTWHASAVDTDRGAARSRRRTVTLTAVGVIVVAAASLMAWAFFIREFPDLDAAADTAAVPAGWDETGRSVSSDSLCIDFFQACDTLEVTWRAPAAPDAATLDAVASRSGWHVESILGCETPQDRCFMTAYVDDDIIVRVTTDAGGDETLVIARFR